MTDLNQLVATPRRVKVGTKIGDTFNVLMEFDASVREQHSSELEVTDHPVEVGSDITDHVRLRPRTLDMQIVMSNFPIVVLASERARGIRGGSPREKAEDAHDEMLRWQEEGLLLTVDTTLKTYDNRVLKRLDAPRDASTGQILSASLQWRQIITAETQIGQIPEPEEPQDAVRLDKGRQNKKAASTELETEAQSTTTATGNVVNFLFGP